MVVHRASEMILFHDFVTCILSSSSCTRMYCSNDSGFANLTTASAWATGFLSGIVTEALGPNRRASLLYCQASVSVGSL